MANNLIEFIINVTGNARKGVAEIGFEAERSQAKVSKFMTAVRTVRDVGLAVQTVTGFVRSLGSAVRGLQEAYNMQAVAETKLAAVMRNTMGATREEIQSILDMASAQQKLGVIGDEVQLAGAQEMATYLGKKASLEKLLPVLNDMLAQQYGLNASQEQAATIGMMLGKVMQGQTGALSRYGYAFDEAQEKILKTGTEAERAAVLFDVVNEAVGGVNASLAQTPEGKLKQLSNDAGDLRERMGRLVTLVQSAFSGVSEQVQGAVSWLISFFERNMDVITQAVRTVAKGVSAAFSALAASVRVVWDVFEGLLAVMPYVGSALALIGVYLLAANANFIIFAAQFYIYTAWLGIVTAATKIWAFAQMLLNGAMALNPVGLIVAGIVALIAVIAFLAIKIKGWGTLWEAVVGFMKNIFLAYVEGIKLAFATVVNGIMIGIDKIRLGWYEFKKAVGLGDSNENAAMITKINAEVEGRKQAIVDGAKKVAEYSTAAVKSFEKVNLSWDSNVTLKDTTDKLKTQLGITDNTQVVNNDLSQNLSQASSSIASGGKSVKNFNITINDGLIKQVDNHFGSAADSPDSASDFMWRLSVALQMILNDVNYE